MAPLLTDQAEKKIDAILDAAFNAGRDMLYEHEVYTLLQYLGLKVPVHRFIATDSDIDHDTLAGFSNDRLVLKASARGLAHKQAVGAVAVAVKELEFIRYRSKQMQTRLEAQGYGVDGILLTEFIPYSNELGNEILLGFRESEAFGPILSFSKGGTDAEFFAAHFSSPNIILTPIDRDWSEALIRSTRIHRKYIACGRTDYVKKIVDAEMALSSLATRFSQSIAGDSRYVIPEFEVNPFVFDHQHRMVALDGYAVIEPRRPRETAPARPDSGMDAFFNPNGVAVIGASGSGSPKPGNIIVGNLVKLGRKDLYPVNPKGGTLTIDSTQLQIYPEISAIEKPVDLAILAVPAPACPAAVAQCVQKQVKAILLIPGGFSETDPNNTMETQMADLTRAQGIRLMGPNCLGVIFSGDGQQPGMNTIFIPEEKFDLKMDKTCNLALISQSGALGLTEIYNLRHAISPRAIVSYGNQIDVDPSDLVGYFDKDPGVKVIACYIEGFKAGAGRKFFNAAAQCNKPIIVYKAGRTQAGRQATESHTASIAGEYEVAKAAMKQAGLVVADTMGQHLGFVKIFSLLSDCRVTGKRIAIIANAGYEKTYAADNLGQLEIASFSQATHQALRKILPPFVGVSALLDLTPMAGDALYEACFETVLQSDSVDAVFLSIVPQGGLLHTTDQEVENNPDNVASRIVRLAKKYRKPAVVSICVTSGADAAYNRFGQILDSGGIPSYLTADQAMLCLNQFIRYHLSRATRAYDEWLR